MNNVAVYYNRYGDKITFEHIGDEVTMEGGSYMRWGYDDEQGIDMVDPSGGPYITIGNNLKEFWPKGKYQDLIVESINVTDRDGVVVFKVKK